MSPHEVRTRGASHGILLAGSRVAVMLFIGLIAQLAIIAAFTGAMSKPTLHDAEIGLVVAPGADAGPLAHTAAQLDFQPLPDAGIARTKVRDGTLPAALILSDNSARLVVASASGVALSAAIEHAIEPPLKAAGVTTTVHDVRALPASDPRGLGTFLLVIGWVLGGYLGVILLTRVRQSSFSSFASTVRTFAWLAAYSIASAGFGVLVSTTILGVVAGNVWSLILVGWLVSFAVCSFTAALMALFGSAGIIVAIACLVVLGNPTSGGAVPDQMLGGGWHVLAELLPTNSGVQAIRAVSYFGGSGMGKPVLVLSLYAGLSILFALAISIVRPRIIAKHVAASHLARATAAATQDAGGEDASTSRDVPTPHEVMTQREAVAHGGALTAERHASSLAPEIASHRELTPGSKR